MNGSTKQAMSFVSATAPIGCPSKDNLKRSTLRASQFHVPMTNVLNRNQLGDMMQRTERRGELC